jgi:Leucine-rich repeat (LRR) protein
LPPEIIQLVNLQTLDLSFNQLTSLPPEIIQLTNLRRLNFSGNPLNELSSGVAQLRNLGDLEIIIDPNAPNPALIAPFVPSAP